MRFTAPDDFGAEPLRTWVRWVLPLADCGADEVVAVVDGEPRIVDLDTLSAVTAAAAGVVRVIRAVDQ
jgi:hypothetical protein